jgi:hypothetical protein
MLWTRVHKEEAVRNGTSERKGYDHGTEILQRNSVSLVLKLEDLSEKQDDG